MACLRLSAPERKELPIKEVFQLLEREFDVFHADELQGELHVQQEIESTERMPDETPGRQGRLRFLTEVKSQAVYVEFGDDCSETAGCVILPDPDIFFERPTSLTEPTGQLVRRAATALGYRLDEI